MSGSKAEKMILRPPPNFFTQSKTVSTYFSASQKKFSHSFFPSLNFIANFISMLKPTLGPIFSSKKTSRNVGNGRRRRESGSGSARLGSGSAGPGLGFGSAKFSFRIKTYLKNTREKVYRGGGRYFIGKMILKKRRLPSWVVQGSNLWRQSFPLYQRKSHGKAQEWDL